MPLLVLGWGKAGDLLELIIEVREIIEACFKTYLRNAHLIIHQ